MACMAACKNSAGLLASRFFLGITEAGLFPGIIFYLSLWYTRGEQATRVALFFSCSTLAGVMIHCIVSKYGLIFFIGIWRRTCIWNYANGWSWWSSRLAMDFYH